MNIVIDINSTVLAGFSAHHQPQMAFDAYHSKDFLFDTEDDGDLYALLNEGVLYNTKPIEPLLNHIYSGLDVSSEDSALTITQNAWADSKITAQLAEIAFETHKVPNLTLLKRQLSTAYAISRPTSSVVLDIDSNYVAVTPISNGNVLKRGILKSNYGGDFINLFSKNFLITHGGLTDDDFIPVDYLSRKSSLAESRKQYLISNSVHEFNRVVLSLHADQPITYVTPTKKQVVVNGIYQRDLVSPLFAPYGSFNTIFPSRSDVPQDAPGLGLLIFQALKSLGASETMYKDLLSNIIIQGSYSFIPGLQDGLMNDLRLYLKDYHMSSHLNHDEMERSIESWVGACVGTSWGDSGVSLEEWQESGWSGCKDKFL